MSVWEKDYWERGGLRWWPHPELMSFLGRRFPFTSDFGAKVKRSTTVLEVGCGNGGNLRGLLEDQFCTWGLDCSDKALEMANSFCQSTFPYDSPILVKGSVLDSNAMPGVMFDAVVDVTCIQHLRYSEHAAAYRNIYAMLKPGGWFFSVHLTEHSTDSYYGARLEDFTIADVGDNGVFPHCGPVCLIPESNHRALLQGAGFQVERFEAIMKTYNGCTQSAHYHVVDARKP